MSAAIGQPMRGVVHLRSACLGQSSRVARIRVAHPRLDRALRPPLALSSTMQTRLSFLVHVVPVWLRLALLFSCGVDRGSLCESACGHHVEWGQQLHPIYVSPETWSRSCPLDAGLYGARGGLSQARPRTRRSSDSSGRRRRGGSNTRCDTKGRLDTGGGSYRD
jgi:hypothetical protein